MLIKDRVMLGPVNLVSSVTAWSNCNRYSMVDVGGRMRQPRMMTGPIDLYGTKISS
jgi:hypothetical protein